MNVECDAMRWLVSKEIVPLYIDTAKSFAALSSGALGLTIIFYDRIVGIKPGGPISKTMVASWIAYLITIAASAFYQYLAVRFLDSVSCDPQVESFYQPLIDAPGRVYGVMLVFFILASVLLVAAAWRQQSRLRSSEHAST
ncbi:hypothetical protein [Variovorax ginsengisoli]|uniref:Uncharacterized protein n=1 Tax=Variovorax ginsengisoli TaxID=363844 RepID=A0ABT8SH81_9BURK|nr:hypothetical protein [Variovorax ginsengisoli]MDN8618925.1 hypothetical protein [Variovorax ginsengisoli]MDO1538095.1 hypothetical protein [Variovorax ginsengisoli]